MLLAEKILELRKQNGWSQEELAEKVGVSRQSISKWESAQSVPDLDKILVLSRIFGVSTDYLLKDEQEQLDTVEDSYEMCNIKTVTMEQASDFIARSRKNAHMTAVATVLCILSPLMLLYLAALSTSGGISEGAAVALGMGCLLVMVAAAVVIFIFTDGQMREYKFLETEDFRLSYDVKGLAQSTLKKGQNAYMAAVCTGVGLCIISPLPLIISSVLGMPDKHIVVMVDVLLAIVALAVFLFISASGEKIACEKLLQQGDYTREEKRAANKIGTVSGIYWTFTAAVYLGISFITDRWDMSWIVWPVAAVLYVVVHSIARMIFLKNNDK